MQEANLQRLLQRFVSHANAVLRANYQTFDAKLSILIGFCESDAEMSQVTAQLKGNLNLNMKQWLEDFWNSGGSFIGSSSYTLPADDEDRAALQYNVLLMVQRGEIPLLEFCISAFGTTHFSEMVRVFNQEFTQPFAQEIERRLNHQLAASSSPHVRGASLVIFHHHDYHVEIGSVTGSNVNLASGDGATASMSPASPAFQEELKHLCSEILDHAIANTEVSTALATRMAAMDAAIARHMSEDAKGRASIIMMLESLWLAKVAEDIKPAAIKAFEKHAPSLLQTFLVDAAKAATEI